MTQRASAFVLLRSPVCDRIFLPFNSIHLWASLQRHSSSAGHPYPTLLPPTRIHNPLRISASTTRSHRPYTSTGGYIHSRHARQRPAIRVLSAQNSAGNAHFCLGHARQRLATLSTPPRVDRRRLRALLSPSRKPLPRILHQCSRWTQQSGRCDQ
jgi:hypothetical protein